MSSGSVSSAVGGLGASIGVATIGLPHVFFFPATCSTIATIGLFLMSRRITGHQPTATTEDRLPIDSPGETPIDPNPNLRP